MVMRVVLVLLHGMTYVAAAVRAISRTRCGMGGSAMIVAGRACVCMEDMGEEAVGMSNRIDA